MGENNLQLYPYIRYMVVFNDPEVWSQLLVKKKGKLGLKLLWIVTYIIKQ